MTPLDTDILADLIGGKHEFYPARDMWTILDEDTRLAGPLTPPRQVYASGWLKQVERYDWSADNGIEIEAGCDRALATATHG